MAENNCVKTPLAISLVELLIRKLEQDLQSHENGLPALVPGNKEDVERDLKILKGIFNT